MKKKFITLGMAYILAMLISADAQRPVPWLTTGNKGINPDSNFLGTINKSPLVFKINKQKAGFLGLDNVSANTAFGYLTLNVNTSGDFNTAIGFHSMISNTTGDHNTATGSGSLNFNTSGAKNTAFGWDALFNNTQGNYNTSVGALSLNQNTTGTENSALGYQALNANTTGSYNTAFGSSALQSNTSAGGNTAMGWVSLQANTSGGGNTAYGSSSLKKNTVGSFNTAVGIDAMENSITGSSNTAIGHDVMRNNSSGSFNTAVGENVLYLNTSGYENTALGYTSLYNNTSGFYNVAVGGYALNSNLEGYYNTAVGHQALKSNTGTAGFNTAVGAASMQYNVSGQYNTAAGFLSLYTNASGHDNTAIGHNTLHFSNGSYNAAFGDSSFFDNNNGNKNTGLGALTGATSTSLHNSTAVGFGARVDASNKVRIGNTDVTSIGGQVNWSVYSDARIKNNIKENVPGLAFINALRPVTYYYNIGKENELLGVKNPAGNNNNAGIEKITFTGFLAQEVDAAAKKINYDFSGVDKSGNIMGLRYAEFVVPLVKAVQELSAENDALKARLDKLESMIAQNVAISSSSQEQTITGNTAFAKLEQNIPNPFSKTTAIGYYLPTNTNNAYINFYSINGVLLKSVQLDAKGNGTIHLNTNELPSGVYRYTLIVNGKIIDSKQMMQSK